MIKVFIKEYLFIVLGSMFYAIGTVFFVFPYRVILGGTSGISVILNHYIPWSCGTLLMIINFTLLFVAFLTLGKEMAVKTVVGSTLTTVFTKGIEAVVPMLQPVLENIWLSAILGAVIVAISSGILFYVGSNSGGTDIIALIVKKHFKIHIGKALLFTDFIIVVFGGIISGYNLAVASLLGLVIKTGVIDVVIGLIKKQMSLKKGTSYRNDP